ncbi:hypothetical protein [Rhodospirillaceae bacterium SYSU D60014]|uniref:hypothetical protein n=1 Tax=Virgifigura deserti TaxID=2268457 RepID=UPI0013C47BF6
MAYGGIPAKTGRPSGGKRDWRLPMGEHDVHGPEEGGGRVMEIGHELTQQRLGDA